MNEFKVKAENAEQKVQQMQTEVLTKGADHEKTKALLEAKIEHLEQNLKVS
jgi:hypothetical protein